MRVEVLILPFINALHEFLRQLVDRRIFDYPLWQEPAMERHVFVVSLLWWRVVRSRLSDLSVATPIEPRVRPIHRARLSPTRRNVIVLAGAPEHLEEIGPGWEWHFREVARP
jgi:hypothetical protein